MGLSTEIWRARIGAFLPIARKMSSCQKPVASLRKRRRRIYRRPEGKPKTNHAIMATVILLLLLLAAYCFNHSPHVQRVGIPLHTVESTALNIVIMYIGINNKVQGIQTTPLQSIVFLLLLLLLCGDIESNPGPKDQVRRTENIHKCIYSINTRCF